MQLTSDSVRDLSFSEDAGDPRWIQGRRFEASRHEDDNALLTALIANAWYDHTYAEPTPSHPGHAKGLHGPYRLDAIAADSFVQVDRASAIAVLDQWALQHGELSVEFTEKYQDFLQQWMPASYRYYELPDMRATAEHEWGWVVGGYGFIEFVAVAPDGCAANLIVASDD